VKIIRHPDKEKLHRPVVALGTFDGVHIGHQKVIRAAVAYAKKIKAHSAVITFDPHPQEIVAPERGLKILTTLKEREVLFAQLGVEGVIATRFSEAIKNLSVEEFVKKYLVDKLGVRHVFVGYDYSFGKRRCGGVLELKKLGKEFGFGVTVIAPVKIKNRIVKSSEIRSFLSIGDVASASGMLGRPYAITGSVGRGNGRGKKLGFPTANLKVDPRKLIPAQGVYAGLADNMKCVINIGSRPTFGSGPSLVEVHILNFHRNIRGNKMTVDFIYHLREEKQFTDARELVGQIKKDIVRAKGLCYNDCNGIKKRY